uniref:SCP domain-containing protein n=1 Tax=Heterorhabditis bacteriophora TaxID=37862 RepID=A0A1I7WWK6_HETBA
MCRGVELYDSGILRRKRDDASCNADIPSYSRVSLSITTLLTISTQANAVKLALPEVSYMKAIDVWMGSCMNDEDLGITSHDNHIALNMLNTETGEPRLRSLATDVNANGARYFTGSDRLKRKRSKANLSRFRQQHL